MSGSDLTAPTKVALMDKVARAAVGTRIGGIKQPIEERVIECPMVMCAAPPENCHYEQDVETNLIRDNGDTDRLGQRCSGSCGRLVCDSPRKRICPMFKCAAPGEGCRHAERTAKGDPNACPSCGEIICDAVADPIPPVTTKPPVTLPPVEPNEPVVCPLYKCVAPPEGCHVSAIIKKDENGWNIGCGQVVCPRDEVVEINPTNVLPIKRRVKPPVICPMYMCAAPPLITGNHCEYSGVPAVDKDGCAIGCGIVACGSAEEK